VVSIGIIWFSSDFIVKYQLIAVKCGGVVPHTCDPRCSRRLWQEGRLWVPCQPGQQKWKICGVFFFVSFFYLSCQKSLIFAHTGLLLFK
jgi:hypothetical protein